MTRQEHIEELRAGGHLDGVRTLYGPRTQEEPQGQTWQCPRCGSPLDMVAEHAFAELWECAQCGYSKVVKQ